MSKPLDDAARQFCTAGLRFFVLVLICQEAADLQNPGFSTGNRRFTLSVMFRITKHIEFCYGHRLLNYAGKCRHLHGHNGRADIVLEGAELDNRGMVVDFTDVKRNLARWIDDHLDHRMILHRQDPAIPMLESLGEPLYLVDENPTAENIARIIYEQASAMGMPVTEISLWETSTSCATYRKPVR